jgi:hypothetical protein
VTGMVANTVSHLSVLKLRCTFSCHSGFLHIIYSVGFMCSDVVQIGMNRINEYVIICVCFWMCISYQVVASSFKRFKNSNRFYSFNNSVNKSVQ